jgi:hypothetical protein
MARRCGCATQKCACHFADSESVKVTGSGTQEDPFTPNIDFPLEVIDTPTLDLILEAGVLSAAVGGSAGAVRFTSATTWNKPAGIQVARIVLIGGGGGGQGGQYVSGTPGGTPALGGLGGQGGGVTLVTLIGADIPSTADILVGAGGIGGAGISSGSGINNGTTGGSTSFGNFVALGGRGGGQAPNALQGTVQGQSGGIPGSSFTPGYDYLAPGGGGAGQSSNAPASSGGYSYAARGFRSPAQASAPAGAPGQAGFSNPGSWMGFGGGGGFTGANGGIGGNNGGGGGGGGYGNASNPSGAGGNGGLGCVLIFTW